MGLKPKPSLHHLVFIHDTRVCVCVCVCLLSFAPLRFSSSIVLQSGLKSCLVVAVLHLGKSGFGFEIEAQGEVLCHPQEGQAE